MKSLILLILTSLFIVTVSFSQSGRFEHITVYSQSLEGNLLGDSPTRSVSVYLPWQYDSIPGSRFSVVYLLHGYTFTNLSFISNFNLKANFDSFFNQNCIQPMIIVIPNNHNFYQGSWYTNSPITGGWEDFVTQDLVEYIDNNYRTSAFREGRGISGHSMGGYGAMMLAMKHPEIYSAVYSLSAAFLVLEDVVLGTMFFGLNQAACTNDSIQFSGLPWEARVMIAAGAAFSPNANPHPFYCDLPADCGGNIIDSTWQKWLEHDPYSLIDTYKNNLLQYVGRRIRFDCGWYDTYLYDANCEFDTALSENNIPHDFFDYDGDHMNKIPERIRLSVLPFFSQKLVDVESENNNIPDDYSLHQNYPNPFNPSTKMKYSIPQTSNVVIKVFDVLGSEIETLVNEEKPFGTYELKWYAENLPSGVYFYRLQAGSYSTGSGQVFVETKKMLLIK